MKNNKKPNKYSCNNKKLINIVVTIKSLSLMNVNYQAQFFYYILLIMKAWILF